MEQRLSIVTLGGAGVVLPAVDRMSRCPVPGQTNTWCG